MSTSIAPALTPLVTSATPDAFAEVRRLYEHGKCLTAYEAGLRLGPLREWPDVEPRLLAGRLALHLGAPRLATLLHLQAWRRNRRHDGARYYYVLKVLESRGALAAWHERVRFGAPAATRDDAGRRALADYHGQCARLLGLLRDFENAEAHMAQAFEASEPEPYRWVERAGLYEAEDRPAKALAAILDGLTRRPTYPPSILYAAHLLQVAERGEEALELLRRGARLTESGTVTMGLVRALLKFRRLDEAEAAVARLDALTPLQEEDTASFIASTRASLAMLRGDYEAASACLVEVKHPFYGVVAGKLRAFLDDPARPAPKRIELAVPFVRQNHMTCAPATLTAISRFWGRPAEHLSVAEEICYDGTPLHSERRWATENGWVTREFRVDWPSATALIDRGIPFTLTLSAVDSGHLVAAIGYDAPTGMLLARDPSCHETIEINAREYFEAQAAAGPRGLVLLPDEERHRLDGIDLPDAALYDHYHALELSLERHDRAAAVAQYRAMQEADPAHRLTLSARSTLAAYDGNAHESLAATDGLLALFPDDQRLQLLRLQSLRQLATREARLAWLKEACEGPSADARLWIEYAIELRADDRQLGAALGWLERAMRIRRDDEYAIHQLAALYWLTGRQDEAAELQRFAACLGERREDYSITYFHASRWRKQTEPVLAFLRARVERLGARSGLPALTLFQALETLDRTDEAFEALEAAVARRPGDGALRLSAANRWAQRGRLDEARAHLAAAEGSVKRTAYLAEAARVARLAGDRRQALAHWREIAGAQPLDLEAHAMIALLLSETASREDAVEHLRAACERFPHHAGLHHQWYQWTAGDSAVERERVLRAILAIDPADAWTWRELALNLLSQSRAEEALAMAREGVALDGTNATSHAIVGQILLGTGLRVEAADAFRTALGRSVEAVYAIRGLVDAAGDEPAERAAALAFVEARILEQAVVGDGVLAFREAARGALTPDELLVPLRRFHEARPELWQAWSALGRHLVEMGRVDEARVLLEGATARFSRVTELWLDLAQVHRERLALDEEIIALERARETGPEATDPVLELATALERAERLEESERLLETAVARVPLASDLRARLAMVQRRRGEHDRAIETLRGALAINPDFEWAWEALGDWSMERGKGGDAFETLQEVAESRPGESKPWVRLAEMRNAAGQPAEALEAAERAIAISPRSAGAHDARVVALVGLHKFREAAAACAPEVFGERCPTPLRGRAAWVDAMRGDLSRAIAHMREVVDAHPEYQWGWAQLVEWYADRDETGEAIRAAERLSWLDPSNMMPLGWLADLRLRTGDRAGAKRAFERAMRLKPDYLFAGLHFLDLQLGDKEIDGARRTLEILRPYLTPSRMVEAEIDIAIARDDRGEALARMRALGADAASDVDVLRRSAGELVQKGWGRELEALLRALIDAPARHPDVPALWVRVRGDRKAYGWVGTYRWLRAMGPAGKEAILSVMGVLADRGREAAGLRTRDFIKIRLRWHLRAVRWVADRAWRADDDYWGQVGYALTALDQLGAATRWMKDWASRKQVEPWMLQNHAVSLFHTEQPARALEVLRAVRERWPGVAQVGPLLWLWTICEACIHGDAEAAEQRLHQIPEEATPEGFRPIRVFAAAMVEVLRAPAGAEARAVRRRLAKEMQQARDRMEEDHAAKRMMQYGLATVARHTGEPWLSAAMRVQLLHPVTWTVIGVLGAVVYQILKRG